MGAGRRTETIHGKHPPGFSPDSASTANVHFRHLPPQSLHAVIFGCTRTTFRECIDNLIFGLPYHHITYVENVKQGMPLFLFNYSDRTMHGVFEAASSGQLNINPSAWTLTGKTPYPAQVRVKLRKLYRPFPEHVYRAAIAENYYSEIHFYFELDQLQTKRLLDLMTKHDSVHIEGRKVSRNLVKHSKTKEEANKDGWITPKKSVRHAIEGWHKAASFIPERETCLFAQEGARKTQQVHCMGSFVDERQDDEIENVSSGNLNDIPFEMARPSENREPNAIEQETMSLESSSGVSSFSAASSSTEKEDKEPNEVLKKQQEQLLDQAATSSISATDYVVRYSETNLEGHRSKEGHMMMEASTHLQLLKEIDHLRKRNALLEQNHVQMSVELQGLKHDIEKISLKLGNLIESGTLLNNRESDAHEVYLLGGYDGQSWLQTVDVFVPATYELVPIAPMLSPRSCAAAAVAIGEIYVFGGGNGKLWYETVENYNCWRNEWISCPAMKIKRGCLAGATVGDHIFALGGGNGQLNFSDVEFYDIHLGAWIPCTSMQCKRFGLAAAEMDGAIYALGGYDDRVYMTSVERYDPREGLWFSMSPMNQKRGSLSAAVLDGKIFAIGGYDGANFLGSVEAYEPRTNCWLEMEMGMHLTRAYGMAAVVGKNIFMFGGTDGGQTIDMVERYSVGTGWQVVKSAKMSKRSFLTGAVVVDK